MNKLIALCVFIAGAFAALFEFACTPTAAASAPPTNQATVYFEHASLMFRRAAAYVLLQVHVWLKDLGLGMKLRCCADDDPDDEDFEKTMLAHARANKKATDKLLEDVSRLDKETKTALEDLTKVKNQMNSIADFEQKLARVNQLLKREARSSFGSPWQRLLANEESVARINLAVRQATNYEGFNAASIKQLTAQLKGMPGISTKALDIENTPGTTLLQTDLLKEIYDILSQYGAWASLGVRNMGTKLTKMPIKTARPIAYVILPNARQIPDDANKAGTSEELEAKLIAVLITVYNELLQDSEFDVSSDVLDDFAEAIAYRMDYLAFRSDGTADATNGGFSGLFDVATEVTADATRTTIAATKYTDWLKCLTGVDPVVLTRSARWWIHPTNIARSVGVQDGNGRPIFQTALEVPNPGSILNLLGYPITPTLVAPSADEAEAQVAAFGDPNGYVVGLRRDVEFAMSDDFKFDYYSRAFRGIARAGFKLRRANAFRVLKLAAS